MFTRLSCRPREAGSFFEEQWKLGPDEQPPLGAHLAVARSGFEHHGVYIGDGKVVHYSGLSRSLTFGPIEEVSLRQFAAGRKVAVRLHSNPRFDALEIAQRARSRLGENAYALFTNNCEHFCEWCVRGTSRSKQIDVLRDGPQRALLAARAALRRFVETWLAIDPGPGGRAA